MDPLLCHPVQPLSAQSRGHRLRVRETGFDPGHTPSYGRSGTAKPTWRGGKPSAHTLPVPPPLAASPCRPSDHSRPCGLLSALVLLPGGAEKFPLEWGPRSAVGAGLGGGCGLSEPHSGHPPGLGPKRALTWTGCWHMAVPSCLHSLSDGEATSEVVQVSGVTGSPVERALPAACPSELPPMS